jgi:lipopolysaccharide transport system ATP-binding protein
MGAFLDGSTEIMNDIAISVSNVSKCYHVYENQRARLRHALLPSSINGVSEIWALKDINFEVRRGESVAIIGRNGSGKSTLLEIITGTLTPTTGTVQVHGRVAALLELGSGFNPEYTGRENVFLNGLLLGLSRAEVERRFDDIVSFADIGDVLDRPVKTYSSGMMMRLAFAVQVALEPDVLIVDEALSVGDFFFQQKCLQRIRELQEKDTTILFVSHDMQTVRDLCQRGLFLQKGWPKFWGDNLTAISLYLADSCEDVPITQLQTGAISVGPSKEKLASLPNPIWANPDATAEVAIVEVGVYDPDGTSSLAVEMGQSLIFRIRYRDAGAKRSHVTMILRNRYNQIVTAVGTYTHNIDLPVLQTDEVAEVVFEVRYQIEAGEYSFQFNIGPVTSNSAGTILNETPWLGPIKVMFAYTERVPAFYGMFGVPITIDVVTGVPSK